MNVAGIIDTALSQQNLLHVTVDPSTADVKALFTSGNQGRVVS